MLIIDSANALALCIKQHIFTAHRDNIPTVSLSVKNNFSIGVNLTYTTTNTKPLSNGILWVETSLPYATSLRQFTNRLTTQIQYEARIIGKFADIRPMNVNTVTQKAVITFYPPTHPRGEPKVEFSFYVAFYDLKNDTVFPISKPNVSTKKQYISDEVWVLMAPYLPKKFTGRSRKYPERELVDAIIYIQETGGGWRTMPQCYPPWKTVYAYYCELKKAGVWQYINSKLV